MAQTREMGRPKDVTVVDFVDFECPYCRMTQAAFEPILEAHRDRVRLVRRQVPLHMHAHALDAARAACCGERLGQGDAMARALFSAPVDQLTREGCEKMAESLGLPLEPYRACVVDPATDARIESDRAEFKAAGGHALPTLWIDGHEIIGAQARAALEQAIDDALVRAGG
jgi:predicted DsbA family dithiol-disulfide isomerase